MICYFDTSAFVPLLIDERGSPASERLWNDAAIVVSSRLLYVEAAAALAQAERMGRIDGTLHTARLTELADLWAYVNVVDIDQSLVERAGTLAREHGLRGYDAVHCASAERLKNGELVVAAGDSRLLTACAALGLKTVNTSK